MTRLMLGDRYSKIVASTLAEIDGLKSLVEDGTVKDVRNSVPDSMKY